MNTQTDHSWLDDTPFTDDIWVEMLVDGELNSSQRTAFIEHIREANDWQRVATAFLDEQVLTESVPFEDHVEPTQPTTKPVSKRKPWSVLAIAASLLVGCVLGFMVRQPETVTIVRTEPAVPAEQPQLPDVDPQPMTLAQASYKPALPAMFQVSDTPSEAVYYTDFSVPQFILDALITAGHKVEIDQQLLGDPNAADASEIVPVNVLKIRKYERLFAVAAMTPQ